MTGEVRGETPSVGFGEALGVWLKIGFLSFGGPAAQIALMHRVLVDEKRWIGEKSFLNALNFCMLLPGPEAMQLATYAGWRMHGVIGGLAAGLSFVIPGALFMAGLASLYASYGSLPAMEILFLGVKAAVLAIVLEALFKVSRKALKGHLHWFVALFAFVALFFFNVPFPIVIIAAGLIGAIAVWRGAVTVAPESETVEDARSTATTVARGTFSTIAVWLAIWLVPIAVIWLLLGGDHVLVKIAIFFSKLAVVTFGGAYAGLAYMAQEVVQNYGWLDAGEMVDGLGLAETTLGPLILVTEFVGFLAAFKEGGAHAFMMGLAGAVITLWATFAPCFLWIFAGAPYVERLQQMRRAQAALAGVTAAVVGVILSLSIWFGLRVLFSGFVAFDAGPVALDLPLLDTLDWRAAILSVLAACVLFGLRGGVIVTLIVTAIASFAIDAFI